MERSQELQRVVLRLHGTDPLSVNALRVQPEAAVRTLRLYPEGSLVLERRAGEALRVEAPEHCALTLPADPAGTQARSVHVPLRLRFPADPPPLGFGAEASFEVQQGCAERPSIRWQQLEGPPLQRFEVLADGYRLNVRMPDPPTHASAPLGVGIVPISPRTQGRVVLEAHSTSGDTHRLQLVATSRATGLPSVAVSQQLLLAGAGWHVERAAPGGKAAVIDAHAQARFTPDAPGRWLLRDAQGTQLALSAFMHDKTPLDCGRSECHVDIARAAEHSPMSHALERSLAQQPLAAVGCMLDCHVSGERGLHDGGFLDVQAQLSWSGTARTRWADLPQPLRRLGGVRCTSCHGPGAIPEPRERALLLRTDVCATCHDAPPAYPHVADLAGTRMARADADARTREQPCARCHTTQGFLERAAERKPLASDVPHVPAGISCAACHAPHASEHAARLVRRMPERGLGRAGELTGTDALCSACHAPATGDTLPFASSAALWRGELQLPAASASGSERMDGPAPHRGVPGGCVGCHGRGPNGRVDHGFAAARERCVPCHSAERALDRSLAARARTVVDAIERACGAPVSAHDLEPLHARAVGSCATAGLTRARYQARLVLEDPAAAVHNATFARQLLDAAEQALRDSNGSQH